MAVYTPDEVLQMGKGPSKMPMKSISIADVQKMQPAATAKPPTMKQRFSAAGTDVKDFVVKAAKEYNTAEQAGMRHPVDYSWGMAKGMLSGLIDMGGLSVEGLTGGAKALMGMSKDKAGENFNKGAEAGRKLMAHFAPAIQKHLEEKGKPEEAAQNALGIIPQAIQAAGDTGFDLTNSPFVGATTQAVGTLASLLGLKGAVDPLAALRRSGEKAPVEAPVEAPVTTPKTSVPAKAPLEGTLMDEEEFTADMLEKHGRPADSHMDAERAMADGDRVFRVHEMDEEPEEIHSVEDMKGYAPDGLYILPKGREPDTIQPAAKPAAIAKPQEPSLDELTAQLWDYARQHREQLSQPSTGKIIASAPEPPVPTGMVRYYHGGAPEDVKGSLWFTSSKADGQGWASRNPGMKLWYVDVPKDHPARGEGDLANGIPYPSRVELPAELANKRKVLGETAKIADPVMFQESGQLVRRSAVQNAFGLADKVAEKTPGATVVRAKMQEYIEGIQRNINPEALGPEAKAAAAVLAKNMAESQMRDANYHTKSVVRRAFWNSRMENADEFISKYEKGEKFSDPTLNQAADAYRAWNTRVANQDAVDHIDYEPIDNYLYHTFQDGQEVADFLGQRYRAKWGDPGFTKDRVFSMYDQAKAAGFKPLYTNPEDIMLARQHASDIAHMKIQSLHDLADAGLAVQIKKGAKSVPTGFNAEFRAPNGERYWVHRNAAQILHNAWNTTSLWQKRGLTGDAFRGAMWLKNTLIPFKLGFSLFHPLHVATIDNATGMVRASKELLSGTKSPTAWFKDMLKSAAYVDSIGQTRAGYRLMNLWKGKLPEGELTDVDRESLKYMVEGGFVPEMPSQYRTGALSKFKDAVQRHSATALWHAPFAALDAMQKPLFQVWIPSLKSASYLADVRSALKADPTLLDNALKRQITFRKLAKSVDNRYGEMAYSTLFWNRWMKDIAVANTLSLGWQMGFLREYGGAATDLGRTLLNKGSVASKARAGLLDRPLFTIFYTTQALAYGGLITWAMTGKSPQSLLDYVYPRVGTTDDGKAKRVSTMFYPKEFWSVADHIKNQGALSGIGSLVKSKSSGVLGLTAEWATGLNSFGEEIRDPNAPAYKQLEQTLANSLSEFEPISLEAIKRGGNPALSISGFTPAPKYVTETSAQSYIQQLYDKYYQGKETPFDRVQKSAELKKLRAAYASADQDQFGTILNQMRDKFKLSPNEEQRITQSLSEPADSAYIKMFKRLSWQEQKRALDKMTPEERETYIPVSNVDHLRYSYEAPE